jgi:hypothetical protein
MKSPLETAIQIGATTALHNNAYYAGVIICQEIFAIRSRKYKTREVVPGCHTLSEVNWGSELTSGAV